MTTLDDTRRKLAEAIIAGEYLTCVVAYTYQTADGTYGFAASYLGDPFAACSLADMASEYINDTVRDAVKDGDDDG